MGTEEGRKYRETGGGGGSVGGERKKYSRLCAKSIKCREEEGDIRRQQGKRTSEKEAKEIIKSRRKQKE